MLGTAAKPQTHQPRSRPKDAQDKSSSASRMALLDSSKHSQDSVLSGVNPDLASERLTASFSVEELTARLDGGAEHTRMRRAVVEAIEKDPVFSRENQYFQSQNERYEAAVKRAVYLQKKMREMGWTENGPEVKYIYRCLSGDIAFSLHRIFMRSISVLGSDKQVAKWIPLATEYQIIGTYAQTELGHGVYTEHTKDLCSEVVAWRHGKVSNPHRGLCSAVRPWEVLRSAPLHRADTQPSGPFAMPREQEAKILDYQTQQQKLLPQLAAAYAFHFINIYLHELFNRGYQEIQGRNFDSLPELHAFSSGFKAIVTQYCTSGLEICLRACGGHGYSQLSGLPSLYTRALASCIYEGENTVLFLQTARFLIKCFMAASAGQPIPPSVTYLSSMKPRNCPAKDKLDFLSPDIYLKAYEQTAIRLLSSSAAKLQHLIQSGVEKHEAWNQCTVQLVKAAKAHCHYITVKNFVETVEKLDNKAGIQKIMKHLCDLFALHGIFSNAGDFLYDGYLSGAQIDLVTASYLDLLAVIRKDAVPLVDAFDFTDKSLNSALGSYDGQVYQRLYEWAQKSPTNQQVNPAYGKYLKPLLQNKLSKL
ncbi:peroxisomal acyl-coenzyme A oxidase 2 isoform X4 [Dromaius novaehollandiae]|uniref:peroxisomal acyl-coenzyme A oxidase 2 isoform X4 n=1 Tax=Dromaius novaehollandiae TaxID=8790 RepID=UPI00311E7FED